MEGDSLIGPGGQKCYFWAAASDWSDYLGHSRLDERISGLGWDVQLGTHKNGITALVILILHLEFLLGNRVSD